MKNQTKSPEWRSQYSLCELTDEGFLFEVDSAYAYFERVKDKRKARGRQYPLPMVLTVCQLAKLSGENTPAGIADWAKERAEGLCEVIGLKRRIVKKTGRLKMPCAGSYSRILSQALEAEDLERVTREFFAAQPARATPVEVNLDGKKIRGTIPSDNPNGVYLLAVYQPGAGVVLMQVLIQAGAGEVTTAPRLLKALDLQGKIVTGAAEFAQRHLSLQIVAAGGDDVWKVKGNQPNLEADSARVFAPAPPAKPGFSHPKPDFRTAQHISAGHGRIERRTVTTSRLLKGYRDWPYVEQVFKYETDVTDKKTGKRTQRVCYGITSLTPEQASAKRLLGIVRGHWRIENQLHFHYRRDVCWQEDHCGLRLPHLAHVFAILNNWVLGLFARSGGGNFAAAQRHFNAHPEDALSLIMRV
ncbi:MAG: ISAs1 family transposase [Chloroflexi bacterium]|nr:ISAs1 family transposase [Chloroflexota bacterium]